MKQVLKIYVNGKFRQHLKKSEVRFIIDICENVPGIITVEIVALNDAAYRIEFN